MPEFIPRNGKFLTKITFAYLRHSKLHLHLSDNRILEITIKAINELGLNNIPSSSFNNWKISRDGCSITWYWDSSKLTITLKQLWHIQGVSFLSHKEIDEIEYFYRNEERVWDQFRDQRRHVHILLLGYAAAICLFCLVPFWNSNFTGSIGFLSAIFPLITLAIIAIGSAHIYTEQSFLMELASDSKFYKPINKYGLIAIFILMVLIAFVSTALSFKVTLRQPSMGISPIMPVFRNIFSYIAIIAGIIVILFGIIYLVKSKRLSSAIIIVSGSTVLTFGLTLSPKLFDDIIKCVLEIGDLKPSVVRSETLRVVSCPPIGPFEIGNDSIMVGKQPANIDVLSDSLRVISGKYIISGLVIVGSSDRRPLKPETLRSYGSNISLAAARGNWVKRKVIAKNIPMIAANLVIVITAGPDNVGIAASFMDMEKDRYVKTYALVSP
jgi:hypothetical protein